jgi:hypothetical protein
LGPSKFKSLELQPFIQNDGAYFLTAVDSNGCVLKDTINISKNTDVPLPMHILTPIDCVSKTGSVFIFSTDSLISATLLSPNNNLTFNQPNFLNTAGSYNIQVAAKNGCKDTFEIDMIRDENFPKNDFIYNNINCHYCPTKICIKKLES